MASAASEHEHSKSHPSCTHSFWSYYVIIPSRSTDLNTLTWLIPLRTNHRAPAVWAYHSPRLSSSLLPPSFSAHVCHDRLYWTDMMWQCNKNLRVHPFPLPHSSAAIASYLCSGSYHHSEACHAAVELIFSVCECNCSFKLWMWIWIMHKCVTV